MPLAIHNESIMISPGLELNGCAPYAVALLFQLNGLLLPMSEVSDQLHAQCSRCSKTKLLMIRCSLCSRHSFPLAWGVPSIETVPFAEVCVAFLECLPYRRNILFRDRFDLCRSAQRTLLSGNPRCAGVIWNMPALKDSILQPTAQLPERELRRGIERWENEGGRILPRVKRDSKGGDDSPRSKFLDDRKIEA